MAHPFRLLAASLALSAALAPAARAERARLSLGDDDSVYVQFPADFVFSFGGVPYKGVWINSNGNLTFGGPTWGPNTNYQPNTLAFLAAHPIIAPLWVDLDLGSGGSLTAGRVSLDEFEVHWEQVPGYGNPGTNTFSVILSRTGTFRFVYGGITSNPSTSTTAIVGYSTGNANTNGQGVVVAFATQSCPTVWGNGTEAAIYQSFTPPTGASVLGGASVCFAAPLPTSGRLTLADDDTVEIALTGFVPTIWSNPYTSLWVNSNGSLTFGTYDESARPSLFLFLNKWARLSPAWRDLDPSGGVNPGSAGTITVTQSASAISVAWNNVPESGNPGAPNTFSVSIANSGSVTYTYGAISLPAPARPVLVGLTGGYPVTNGMEAQSPIPNAPAVVPSGVSQRYEILTVGAFPHANTSILWDAGQAAFASAITMYDDDSYEVLFPFGFPFGGTEYRSAFMNSDGYVCLGFNVINQPYDFTTLRMLDGFPRIAPLWSNYRTNPNGFGPEGSYRVTTGANAVTFTWTDVPDWTLIGANNFSLTLGPGRVFTTTYGAVTVTDGLVGLSNGGGKTIGSEMPVTLSTQTQPVGSGSETAIFEVFQGNFNLTGSIPYTGASPILYQGPVTSPGLVRIAIGAAPQDGGKNYVVAMALGSSPGISIPGCATIPLNLDPLFLLSLQGLVILNHLGVLDGWGQKDGWPAVPPGSPIAVPVPPGLPTGFTAWVAFVTYPGGGPCPLSTISPAQRFTIQ